MNISDELRDRADGLFDRYGEFATWLRRTADRIDAEMVELPRDVDGVPIHVGDTVYLKDGLEADVQRVNISSDHASIDFQTRCDGSIFVAEPTRFTHTRPDSWGRIADELEEWSEDNRVNGDSEVFDRAADYANRIRKIAESEEER